MAIVMDSWMINLCTQYKITTHALHFAAQVLAGVSNSQGKGFTNFGPLCLTAGLITNYRSPYHINNSSLVYVTRPKASKLPI